MIGLIQDIKEPHTISTQAHMDTKALKGYIDTHKGQKSRYIRLYKAYMGSYKIVEQKKKERYKPDNRLVCNFAKYIVDTFNGFFIGNPIKTTHDDVEVADYIKEVENYNNQNDVNAELSKLCSIYGRAYELLYIDEQSKVATVSISPMEAFIVYDDSIRKRPRYGVRYYINSDGVIEGSFSDEREVFYFIQEGTGFRITEVLAHNFSGVPIIEYVENTEKQGIFEGVLSLIDGYNKALSEKANDVDYYADSYLKIIGAELDEEDLEKLRDNRIINLPSVEGSSVAVDFLGKPEADTTQENLINRIERLIYQLSMVANINDETFGNASGISLKYKLQPMINLATVKERKFIKSMSNRWELIASVPVSKMSEDAWVDISYSFTKNLPANELEEAQIAGMLAGIVSEHTQLKILSVVDDINAELERKEKDEQGDEYTVLGQEAGEVSDESRLKRQEPLQETKGDIF